MHVRANFFRHTLGKSGNHGSGNWKRDFGKIRGNFSDTFLAKFKSKEPHFSETTSARCVYLLQYMLPYACRMHGDFPAGVDSMAWLPRGWGVEGARYR